MASNMSEVTQQNYGQVGSSILVIFPSTCNDVIAFQQKFKEFMYLS